MSPYWSDVPAPKRQPKRNPPAYNTEEQPTINPNHIQYPDQQPVERTKMQEKDLPLHLRRGAQYHPIAAKPLPDNMQNRYAEVQKHYQENPETTEPAPKHRRINLSALLTAAFIALSFLGIIGAIMNFMYSRGNANLATSVSFLHAELAVMFIAMILMFVSQHFRR
jgi:hypothetical protein